MSSPQTRSTRRLHRQAPARKAPEAARRAKLVWLSFLGAMTLVGSVLMALDDRPAPRLDGLSFAPLLASTSSSGVDAILRTRAGLDHARWQAIVIHHTGSPVGSPASIGAEHEKAGFRGLGHHFIIGNGSGMEDGELHVGFRWLDQLPGAHAAGNDRDWYNLHAVSICLVGDGGRRPFTAAQSRRLAEVVSTLCRNLGIPRAHVYLHSDIGGAADPGPLFPTAQLQEQLAGVP